MDGRKQRETDWNSQCVRGVYCFHVSILKTFAARFAPSSTSFFGNRRLFLSLPLSLSVGCFAVHCCCTHANRVHRVWQRKLKRIGQTVCLLLAEILIFMKVVNGFCKHLWGRVVNWANIVSMRRPAHVFSSHSLDYYAVMSNKKRTIYDTVFFLLLLLRLPALVFPLPIIEKVLSTLYLYFLFFGA